MGCNVSERVGASRDFEIKRRKIGVEGKRGLGVWKYTCEIIIILAAAAEEEEEGLPLA